MVRMRKTSILTVALIALASAPLLLAADKPKEGGKRWSGDGISWELPEGWKQDEKPSGMRFTTIRIPAEPKPLELTVIRLSGDGGGLRPNIDRWRMQIGLGPVGEDELAKQVKEVETAGGKARVADMHNPSNKQRLIGVILPGGKETWFFKLTGANDTLEPHKEKLMTFLKSVKVEKKA